MTVMITTTPTVPNYTVNRDDRIQMTYRHTQVKRVKHDHIFNTFPFS